MNVARQLEGAWNRWGYQIPFQPEWTTESEATAILVIDDDPLFGELFVEYARREGHFAAYFTNLDELGALNILEHYHVALVDYDLGPGLDGLKIAEMFKGYDSHFPVVLTTATSKGQAFSMYAESEQIEGFIRKQDGLASILNQVVATAQRPQK